MSQLHGLNDMFREMVDASVRHALDTPSQILAVTTALTAATTSTYCPQTTRPNLAAVRFHTLGLHNYGAAYPHWAIHAPHLPEVACLKEQIRAAWDMATPGKDVGLAQKPHAP